MLCVSYSYHTLTINYQKGNSQLTGSVQDKDFPAAPTPPPPRSVSPRKIVLILRHCEGHGKVLPKLGMEQTEIMRKNLVLQDS
jgi:hypothetical protein